jgi:hypothetical protein
MKKSMFVMLGLAAALAMPTAQAANGIDPSSVYFGGGLSRNSLSGFEDATGWQIFGGMDFAKAAPFIFGAEVGYMDSGNFGGSTFCAFGLCIKGPDVKATGLWATGVAKMPINNQLNLIGRLGLDFGDDDGLMVGIGAGYKVNKQLELRGEYVDRQNIGSLQFNVAFYPNAR